MERWEDREGAKRAAYRFSLVLVKKDKWYESILYALRKTGHNSLADDIEGIRRQDNETGELQGGGGVGGGGGGGGVGGGGRREPPVDEGTKRTMHYGNTCNPHELRQSNVG